MTAPRDDSDPAAKALGLWDAVSIIVGIVVGTTIFQMAPLIFMFAGSPQVGLSLWVVGGLVSLFGALCYAELASAYPREGGDIVYLTRAYGRWAGFLFGWAQLTVILTGSIGAMAFAFANYSIRLAKDAFGYDLGAWGAFGLAGGAILLLTLTNIVGVVAGKIVQNVLTAAKILGLGAIIAVGFMSPHPGAFAEHSAPFAAFPAMIGTALVFVLYAYGGWNDAAFVAAEVKDGKKNITRSLLLGIGIITALYLLVNAAYINCLGYAAATGSKQIAADVLGKSFGTSGSILMSVLVMVSALGAINGLIFTGARVYATLGQEYAVLGWMGGWVRERGAPIPALATQGVLALALVFLIGTQQGRDGINALLDRTATATKDGKPTGHVLPPIKWEGSRDEKASEAENAAKLASGSFDTLVACTSPIFWSFFLLTGMSLFVLRERDAGTERPFKVPFYPELPLAFCVSCGYMLYSSIVWPVSNGWQGGVFLLGVLPLLVALPLYRISALMGDDGRSDSRPLTEDSDHARHPVDHSSGPGPGHPGPGHLRGDRR